MEIVFIGGPLHDEAMSDIKSNTKGSVWYSADLFQKKIIHAIEKSENRYHIISAPLVGAYPVGYKKIFFNAPNITDEHIHCVSFFNVWGVRNYSRAIHLKKAISKYLLGEGKEYLIIVYCAHQPFLEAAIYLKSKVPNSKICFYVPDLPQYMNLNNHSLIYDIAKKFDIRRIEKLIKHVDSFVILTEQMKEMLQIGTRPYFVAEGIVDSVPRIFDTDNGNKKNIIKIVYAGGLQTSFGIEDFILQFKRDNNPHLRLVICGDGDERDNVIKAAYEDNRIEYKGQLLPREVAKLLKSADILINPRRDISEYNKYSFPSKNIEYLLTGKRVVACMLEGMPKQYRKYIYEVHDGNYMKTIYEAINNKNHEEKIKLFYKYAETNLLAKGILERIKSMVG